MSSNNLQKEAADKENITNDNDPLYKINEMSAYDTLTRSHHWMKQKYHLMVLITSCAVVVGLFSLALNILQFIYTPEPRYFAQTPDLKITEMIPLDHPRDSDEGISLFVSQVLMKTLSLDFKHWREDLMNVEIHYTANAFSELVKSMKQSGMLDMITDKNLVVNAIIKSAPIIEAKGIENGVYSWRVAFPLLVSYESSQGVISNQNLDVTVWVIRVSPSDNPAGVQVRQVVLKPSTKKQQ